MIKATRDYFQVFVELNINLYSVQDTVYEWKNTEA